MKIQSPELTPKGLREMQGSDTITFAKESPPTCLLRDLRWIVVCHKGNLWNS